MKLRLRRQARSSASTKNFQRNRTKLSDETQDEPAPECGAGEELLDISPTLTIPDFEMMPSTALQAPHIIIARYQIRLLREGATLDRPHPWIPPHLLSKSESTSS